MWNLFLSFSLQPKKEVALSPYYLALHIPNSHFYVFSIFLLYDPIEESTQNNFGYGLVENNDFRRICTSDASTLGSRGSGADYREVNIILSSLYPTRSLGRCGKSQSEMLWLFTSINKHNPRPQHIHKFFKDSDARRVHATYFIKWRVRVFILEAA